MPELAAPVDASQRDDSDLTIDELAATVGLSVRTVRFYAGKKLLPTPRLEGRTGRYGPIHVARLSLVRDLQRTGYTLAAIEEFLTSIPDDADASSIEMFGTLLVPWVPSAPMRLTVDELAEPLGRAVDDELLEMLDDAHVVDRLDDGMVATSRAQLDYGVRLLALDAPVEALVVASRIIQGHATEMAEELQREFRSRILPRFDHESADDRTRLHGLVASLRPLVIQAIVTEYTDALDREVRAQRGR